MSHKARDYMSKRFLTFLPDTDVLEAVQQIVDKHMSGGFVIDKLGNLVGVLSEVDGLRPGSTAPTMATGASASRTSCTRMSAAWMWTTASCMWRRCLLKAGNTITAGSR